MTLLFLFFALSMNKIIARTEKKKFIGFEFQNIIRRLRIESFCDYNSCIHYRFCTLKNFFNFGEYDDNLLMVLPLCIA